MLSSLLSMIAGVLRFLRQKWFASFCSFFAERYNEAGRGHKHSVFKHLNETIRSRKAGSAPFRLLEIGGGSGANFGFVDSPVEWTVVEPNAQFAPFFRDNIKDESKMRVKHDVKDLVEAYGEDLSVFPDASFDAAVITLVLCSVSDVDRVLSEVKRVLRPGGSFYFVEHVAAPQGSALRRLQAFLCSTTGLWPVVMDGCYLDRDIERHLRDAGFAEADIHRYEFSSQAIHYVFKTHIRGRLTK